MDGIARAAAGGEKLVGGEFGGPGFGGIGSIGAFEPCGDAGVDGLGALPVQRFCGQGGRAAGVSVEPGVGEGAVRRLQDHPACFLHGGEDAPVDGGCVVGLGLGDVGGNVSPRVAALLFADELHHEGAREDRLCLEGLHGPIGGDLTGNDAGDVAFGIHADEGVLLHDPDVEEGDGGLLRDGCLFGKRCRSCAAGQQEQSKEQNAGAAHDVLRYVLPILYAVRSKNMKSAMKIIGVDTPETVYTKTILKKWQRRAEKA